MEVEAMEDRPSSHRELPHIEGMFVDDLSRLN